MKPFLSFIIPTLNEEKCLPLLLEDLQNQQLQNFEVIVVDGKSQDNTCAIATSFKKHFPLSVVKTSKRNVSYQRNKGAKAAKGEYLCILDADFRLPKSFTRNIVESWSERHYLLMIPALKPQKDSIHDATYLQLTQLLSEISQSMNKPFTASSTLVIHKDLYKIIGGYDEKLFVGEDHEIVQRAYQSGVRPKFLHDAYVKYSFRRFETFGAWDVYSKYIRSTVAMILDARVEEKIYEYEMGGSAYEKGPKKQSLDEFINAQINGMRTQVQKVIKSLNEI